MLNHTKRRAISLRQLSFLVLQCRKLSFEYLYSIVGLVIKVFAPRDLEVLFHRTAIDSYQQETAGPVSK